MDVNDVHPKLMKKCRRFFAPRNSHLHPRSIGKCIRRNFHMVGPGDFQIYTSLTVRSENGRKSPPSHTLFWHRFSHTIWKYVWQIIAYIFWHSDIFSAILSDILSGIYSDILSNRSLRYEVRVQAQPTASGARDMRLVTSWQAGGEKMWWFHLGWGLSPFFLRPIKTWEPTYVWLDN